MKNDDLCDAALEIQDDIRRAYRKHKADKPVMLFHVQEQRIYAYPYLSYKITLSERSQSTLKKDYEEAQFTNKIVVFVRDEDTRRLVSFLLPQGVTSPIELIPADLRHKLELQDCFNALSGLGQFDDATLETEDQKYRVDDFMDNLRACKDSVEYLDLTLDSLLTRVILPDADKPIFVKMMQEKLGLKSTTDRIADCL